MDSNRLDENVDWTIRSVDLNRARFGDDQPREQCTVRRPFAHLRAKSGEAVRSGFQLDHELRGDVPHGRIVRKTLAALARDPRGIR